MGMVAVVERLGERDFRVILDNLRQGKASSSINGSDLTRNNAFKHRNRV